MNRKKIVSGLLGVFVIVAILGGLLIAKKASEAAETDTEMDEKKLQRKVKNRLADEKSPYLQQHAENPVDWYPWGEEAFARARAEDKPVFLSIGYSTCHWCHVMAHESFEDEQVAALMNEAFINIKVDREERPDIDDLYMTACQMMTGSGGWPLTIIMTPDKKPFFAATYIPKANRYGRLGMIELIPRIVDLWRNEREKADEAAEKIVVHLQSATAVGQSDGTEILDRRHFEASARVLWERFDTLHGGFGDRPKFPTPHKYTFLLRHWRRTGNAQSLEIVDKTLSAMRAGGLFDQVGFGFHRYSTDRQWLVPHFEKMLYDQALLAPTYLEAYQATGRADFAQTAREIFAYVRRDLSSPDGGFYSAEDADSEGEEGKFYVFTHSELQEILGEEDATFAAEVFGARPGGNFVDEAAGGPTGTNILHQPFHREEIEKRTGLDHAELEARMERIRKRLFAARAKRVRPHLDDKVLTDWNGLMIAAFARGGQVLDEPELTDTARRAAAFIEAKLSEPDGRLRHRYRDGEADIPGFLDDYAFYAWGLLELYEATFNTAYLQRALELTGHIMAHFHDAENGGFFFSADDAESLLVRRKDLNDGALPAGNSVALFVLVKLARLTGDAKLEAVAAETIDAFASSVKRTPGEFTHFLSAVDFAYGPSFEVVIAGREGAADTKALLQAARKVYQPAMVVVFRRLTTRRRRLQTSPRTFETTVW